MTEREELRRRIGEHTAALAALVEVVDPNRIISVHVDSTGLEVSYTDGDSAPAGPLIRTVKSPFRPIFST